MCRSTLVRPPRPEERHAHRLRHGDQQGQADRSPTPRSICGWARRCPAGSPSTAPPSAPATLPGTDRCTESAASTPSRSPSSPPASAGTSRSPSRSSELELDDDGVYQLGVSLSGQTRTQPYEQVLGIERTFLPWQPEATEKKTQLTYLWPLISSTHLTAETGSDEQQTPVFEDDDLAKELAPGGRLEQMVSLGKDLPVTWVIDPDLLATVDAMTKNYRVKNGDHHRRGQEPGRRQAVAELLEAAVQGRKVVALPFADPDLASLAHRGKNVSGSLSHLQPATEVAETTVETILHVKPSTDFAWPVDGAIDSVDRRCRHLGRRPQGDRPQRQPPETNLLVHAHRGPADRRRHHRGGRRRPALHRLPGRHAQGRRIPRSRSRSSSPRRSR